MNDREELRKIIDELPKSKLELAAAYLQGLIDGSTDIGASSIKEKETIRRVG